MALRLDLRKMVDLRWKRGEHRRRKAYLKRSKLMDLKVSKEEVVAILRVILT